MKLEGFGVSHLKMSKFMGKLSEILKGEVLVLIDFFAEWCDPCKMILYC